MENQPGRVETPLTPEQKRIYIAVRASVIDAEASQYPRGFIDHPVYQELLGMGEDTVRVILQELASEGALERPGFLPGWRHELIHTFGEQTNRIVVFNRGSGDWLYDQNQSFLTWGHQNGLLEK